MIRVLPETDMERKILCMGAMYIEENNVLDALEEIVGGELENPELLTEDDRENVLAEMAEYFFRLDMNFGAEARGDCIGILEEMWGVFDKESAQVVLTDIRQNGHRTKFNVLKGCLPADGTIDPAALEKFKQIFLFDFQEGQEIGLKDEDFKSLARWIQNTNKYISGCGILGWDVARHTQLVRLCFVAGHFSDNECWAEILKWAPALAGQFKDWTEFSQSFLIGRTFWAGRETPEAKGICERLLGHPASPWKFYEPSI